MHGCCARVSSFCLVPARDCLRAAFGTALKQDHGEVYFGTLDAAFCLEHVEYLYKLDCLIVVHHSCTLWTQNVRRAAVSFAQHKLPMLWGTLASGTQRIIDLLQ